MKQRWIEQSNNLQFYQVPVQLQPNPVNDNEKTKTDFKRVGEFIKKAQKKYIFVGPSNADRFNKNLELQKQLSTFVDYTKLIKSSNVLNNKQFLDDVQRYRVQRPLDFVAKNQYGSLSSPKEQLYKELCQEEKSRFGEDFDEKYKLALGSPYIETSPTIGVLNYKTSRLILKKAIQPTHKKYSSQTDIDKEYIFQHEKSPINQQVSGFEDNKFYQIIENTYQNVEKRIISKQTIEQKKKIVLEAEQKKQKKDEILQKMASYYGIDLDGEQPESGQLENKIYLQFQKRSQQLLSKAMHASRSKHKLKYQDKKEKVEYNEQISERVNNNSNTVDSVTRFQCKKQYTSLSPFGPKLKKQQNQTKFVKSSPKIDSLTQIFSQPIIGDIDVQQDRKATQESIQTDLDHLSINDLQRATPTSKSKNMNHSPNHRVPGKLQLWSQRESKQRMLKKIQVDIENLRQKKNFTGSEDKIETITLHEQFEQTQLQMEELLEKVDFYKPSTIQGFKDENLFQPQRNMKQQMTNVQKLFKKGRSRVLKIIKNFKE